MHQQLAQNLYLINSAADYEAVQVLRLKKKGVLDIKEPRPQMPEPWHPCRSMFVKEYPALMSYVDYNGVIPTIVPVAKAMGGMGVVRQLDMSNVFKNYTEACMSCVPFKQPRILLNAITIKPRTVSVGYIGHVHSTHNPDLMEAIANLGEHGAKLKALRIQFGDGQFHGSVEMNQEMMFVAQTRDITDHIVHVSMNADTGKFTADYIFNHYDFMNATPELREYKDLSKWEISVSTSVESSLDTGKKD